MNEKLQLMFFIFVLLVVTANAEFVTDGSFNVVNLPPILNVSNYTGDAGDLVLIDYGAYDPNDDNLTFNFSLPLDLIGSWQSNETDTGVTEFNITVSDGVNNVTKTGYIKLSPYCGDGVCDSTTEGERCDNCATDCGSCPVVNSPSSGGSSGGGSSSGGSGGSYDPSYIDDLKKEISSLKNLTKNVTDDFDIDSDKIYLELGQDEFQEQKLILNNYDNKDLLVTLDIQGELNKSIKFEEKYLDIKPNSKKEIKLLILANLEIGKYNSNLYVVSANGHQIIPIQLVVKEAGVKPEQESLDLDVDVISETIEPGQDFQLKLSMRKAPLIEEVPTPVKIRYLITPLDTDSLELITGKSVTDLQEISKDDQRVLFYEEEVELTNAHSFAKTFSIPDTFPTGKYVLNVNADFKGKSIPLFAKFEVKQKWYNEEVMNVKKGILTAGLIFASMLWMAFAVFKINSMIVRKSKFIKIDKKKLPKKGAYLGIIPEFDKKAYINLNELTKHALLTGSTGSGKTMAARVLVEEAIEKGVNVIVFDPTDQWSSVLKPNNERKMLKRFKTFEMDTKEVYGYGANLTRAKINLKDVKGMNLVLLDNLNGKQLNNYVYDFINKTIKDKPKESSELKYLLVFDEVHRLLPKFGGGKKGFNALEKAVREFRKWGIGMVLISQVGNDFLGAIESNIGTNLIFKTKDKDDLNRIKEKYDDYLLKDLVKSPIGTGLMIGEYNNGEPYFISFRPVRQSTKGLSKEEIDKRIKLNERIKRSKKGKIEKDLATKELQKGNYDLAEMYLK